MKRKHRRLTKFPHILLDLPSSTHQAARVTIITRPAKAAASRSYITYKPGSRFATPTRVSLLPRRCPKRRLNNQPCRADMQLSYFLDYFCLIRTLLLSPKKLAISRRGWYFEISPVPRESPAIIVPRMEGGEEGAVNETGADSYKWTIRLNAGFL